MMRVCPNCGFRHRSDGFASDLSREGLSPRERTVLERLVEAGGAPVTRAKLVDAVYGDDPDGGPLFANANIAVYIYRLNQKLPPRGFSVELHGYGMGWKLVEVAS